MWYGVRAFLPGAVSLFRLLAAPLSSVVLVLAACGGDPSLEATLETEDFADDVSTDEGPLGSDLADRSCQVVVRESARARLKSGAFATSCESSGTCHQIFDTFIEVPLSLAQITGAKVGLSYRSSRSSTWRKVTGSKVSGGAPGFQRYRARMSRGTYTTNLSYEEIQAVTFELAAFYTGPDGKRLFDHNRNGGELDNVRFSSAHDFALKDDASVCHGNEAHRGTVRFTRELERQQQRGAIVAGGKLHIDYDLYRLPGCMGSTYNGLAAWSTIASGRFLPGGQTFEAQVKGSADYSGRDFYSLPVEVDVPQDATGVELWFMTSGRQCSSAWDSNDGRNFYFPVAKTAPAPVAWAGNLGGSFARDCAHRDGLADPVKIDSYVMERACSFVDVEVYVDGLTAQSERPELLIAQAVWSKDGQMPTYSHLRYVGRSGNNYRYQWDLPRADMKYTAWQELRYSFRFSTDGRNFFRVGRAAGPDGGATKVVAKDF